MAYVRCLMGERCAGSVKKPLGSQFSDSEVELWGEIGVRGANAEAYRCPETSTTKVGSGVIGDPAFCERRWMEAVAS